jgi:hypothetical protein
LKRIASRTWRQVPPRHPLTFNGLDDVISQKTTLVSTAVKTSNPVSIVTSHLSSQPIQRFVARQQLRKYATIMQALLGGRSRVTMEIQFEECFLCGPPRRYITPVTSSREFSTVIGSRQPRKVLSELKTLSVCNS